MRKQPVLIPVLVALASFAGCGGGEPTAPATVPDNAGADAANMAATQITADHMRDVVRELSDDKYEGRGPGSRGDDAARRYLIGQMEDLGLQPGAADGSWEQMFNLVGVTADQPPEWTFAGPDASLTLNQWDDFIVASGVQARWAEVQEAEVVFVGYGIEAPEYDWDDFKDADLTGKVLLMLNNDPDWDPDLFAGETRLYYGRWTYKYESAARQGAAGAIIIHTQPSAGYPYQVVQTSWTGEQFELAAAGEPRLQVEAWVTEDSARSLVDMAGLDLDALREAADNRDFEPVPLGVMTSIGMDVSLNTVETANLLGLIPGNDPELNEEVVIYTAHHDHLGIGTPDESGDAIYNGAMDNASGVAQLFAIARALQALPEPPRRSILFALVGAEEQGLLGSLYYANNPTFQPGKIAGWIALIGAGAYVLGLVCLNLILQSDGMKEKVRGAFGRRTGMDLRWRNPSRNR